MATTTWQGGVDGDYTDDGNWSGAHPANGDTAIIDGAVAIDTNVANDGDELATIYVASSRTADIGALGNPLELQTDTLVDRGIGDTHFQSTDAGGTAHTALVICDKPKGTLYLDHDGNSDITRVVVLRGNCVIAGTATLTIAKLDIAYKNNPQTDANVTISAGCGATTLVNMIGGKLASAAVLTDLILNGGEVEQKTAAITTLRQTNGVCKYMTSATITAAYVLGGQLNLTESAHVHTITQLYQFPGAEVLYNPSIDVVAENSFGDQEI